MKLPVVIATGIDGWYINDADGEYLCFVSRKFHVTSATAEAIVAAVNGQAALRKIVRHQLAVLHADYCDDDSVYVEEPENSTEDEIDRVFYEAGMKCPNAGCRNLAAAIREAGGECGCE